MNLEIKGLTVWVGDDEIRLSTWREATELDMKEAKILGEFLVGVSERVE